MDIKASDVKTLRDMTGAGMLDCKKALTETNGDIDKAVDYLREKGISKAAKKQDRIAAEGLANIYIDGNKAVILEVNSETDFVSKNQEFQNMVKTIGETILKNEVSTVEEVLNLSTGSGTVNDLIINETATIGEKLSLRRFALLTKNDDEVFGSYLHMGGRIASLVIVKNGNEEIAKDVAMQSAAMKPKYVNRDEVPNSEVEHERTVLTEQALNEGAKKAVLEKESSLLPIGVLKVVNEFKKGEVVSIMDENDNEFARGIANYSSDACKMILGCHSDDILKILGYKNYDAIITRDNITTL